MVIKTAVSPVLLGAVLESGVGLMCPHIAAAKYAVLVAVFAARTFTPGAGGALPSR